jgi:hypothetical protein
MNTRKSKLVGTKKPLVKANYGRISKNPHPMDQPKPNPYGSKDKPVNKDVPSVKPQNLMNPTHWADQSGSGKGPKIPMDVINKDTKKPGKVGQFINRVKSNMQEKKSERLREKEYKKNPKMDSYKVGGMVNSNAKVLADKTPGSKGTKVGLNKRVSKPKGKKC